MYIIRIAISRPEIIRLRRYFALRMICSTRSGCPTNTKWHHRWLGFDPRGGIKIANGNILPTHTDRTTQNMAGNAPCRQTELSFFHHHGDGCRCKRFGVKTRWRTAYCHPAFQIANFLHSVTLTENYTFRLTRIATLVPGTSHAASALAYYTSSF